MSAEFARRRLLMTDLRELGFGIPAELIGAYYLLVDARHLVRRASRRLPPLLLHHLRRADR
jgi:hypothetical protein